MVFKISDNSRLTLNTQYSSSSNIPRFDKLNDNDAICNTDSLPACSSIDSLKFHSYYYGPQKRLFSSLKLDVLGYYFDRSDFTLSYQNVQESRHRWYLSDYLNYINTPDNYDGFVRQYEDVDVYSFNTNLKKADYSFGSEIIYNTVSSRAGENNETVWGIEDTRYPPDGSSIFSAALYNNMFKRLSQSVQLEAGIRYTFSHLMGAYPDSLRRSILGLDGLSVSSKNHVLSGNIKFIFYPSDNWKISSVTSKGFHSPNVDDMLKVFIKGDNITLPNIKLKPEYSFSQELSISTNILEQLELYGVAFYTQLTNAIIKDSLKIILSLPNGEELVQQNIYYNGEYYTPFANQNSNQKTYIYGLTIGLNTTISGVEINGDFNITRGRQNGQNPIAVAHIPPSFGKIKIQKKFNKLKLQMLYLYSHNKHAHYFDDAGVDNLDETPFLGITNGEENWAGLPSWWIMNLSGHYKFSNNLTTMLGIDNLFDAHYKTFGSGISSPGRSLVFSAKYLF